MFKELDPILHSQLRLSIVSILMSVDEANFNFIKDETQATSGNLSIQIKKLKDAGYIEVKKTLRIIIQILLYPSLRQELKHLRIM
jgi:predicted transcriptional regulator